VEGAEADARATADDILPVVVVVGDTEMALVLAAVVIGVADEGALEVVVEVGIRYGHEVGRVRQIE